MTSTSIAEVRHAFTRMTRGAERVGIDTSRWILEEGSTTYGRAFRVFRVGDEHGVGTGHYNALAGCSNGFVGMTRREALIGLDSMATAFHAAADVMERTRA